jgi:hypothetical protein
MLSIVGFGTRCPPILASLKSIRAGKVAWATMGGFRRKSGPYNEPLAHWNGILVMYIQGLSRNYRKIKGLRRCQWVFNSGVAVQRVSIGSESGGFQSMAKAPMSLRRRGFFIVHVRGPGTWSLRCRRRRHFVSRNLLRVYVRRHCAGSHNVTYSGDELT